MSSTEEPVKGTSERWELDLRPVDVIVFGSQLAYGTVGTNASLPVLTGARLRVATVPTTLLSNLPSYRSVHTHTVPSSWLASALDDLTALGVAEAAGTICTGYFAAPEQVRVVAEWLRELLAHRPGLRVVVDPTLGDDDVGAYTDHHVADALRDQLLPLANGLTPNLYELDRLLPAHPLRDLDESSLAELARGLLGPRGEWVVVTGADLPERADVTEQVINLVVTPEDHTVVIEERVDTAAKGTGDVFAASLVRELHHGASIIDATTAAAEEVCRSLRARSVATPG